MAPRAARLLLLLLQQATFQEVREVAMTLEPLAASLAAHAADPADLQALEENTERTALLQPRNDDSVEANTQLVELDVEFHALVGRASPSACSTTPRYLDLATLHSKRLTVFGVSNKLRTKAQRSASVPGLVAQVLPHFAAGRIRPQIDRTFDFDHLAQAKAHMEAGNHVGKIVLRMPVAGR